MAKKGDWVRIHKIILKAEERTGKLPEDTQKVPLEMWTKGKSLLHTQFRNLRAGASGH